jgi:transcriptional regulator with XRE-family HTH domain
MAMQQGPFYEALGANVCRLRQAANLTQQHLATKVGLTRTSITNIEKGRQPVQAHVLIQIVRALKTSVNEVLPQMPDESTPVLPNNLDEQMQAWVKTILDLPPTPSEK